MMIDWLTRLSAETEKDQERAQAMAIKFNAYAPHFTELMKLDYSARAVLKVVENANMADNGGKLISHLGNRQWL
jgi:hypothetical protein